MLEVIMCCNLRRLQGIKDKRRVIPLPDIMSRILGCRRTVLRLGEDIAMDLADLSKCSMLA